MDTSEESSQNEFHSSQDPSFQESYDAMSVNLKRLILIMRLSLL